MLKFDKLRLPITVRLPFDQLRLQFDCCFLSVDDDFVWIKLVASEVFSAVSSLTDFYFHFCNHRTRALNHFSHGLSTRTREVFYTEFFFKIAHKHPPSTQTQPPRKSSGRDRSHYFLHCKC